MSDPRYIFEVLRSVVRQEIADSAAVQDLVAKLRLCGVEVEFTVGVRIDLTEPPRATVPGPPPDADEVQLCPRCETPIKFRANGWRYCPNPKCDVSPDSRVPKFSEADEQVLRSMHVSTGEGNG